MREACQEYQRGHIRDSGRSTTTGRQSGSWAQRKGRHNLRGAIDSPCECEHKNPDSLDARLFPSVVLAVAPAATKLAYLLDRSPVTITSSMP